MTQREASKFMPGWAGDSGTEEEVGMQLQSVSDR